jgi:hypothetical protein
MSDTIKIAMFQSGKTIAIDDKGKTRQATKEESVQHLASLLPKANKTGSKLASVKYDKGYVYGLYEDKTQLRNPIFAQAKEQTEPVDGPQKVKDTKVPRDKSKAKPEVDVKRPDVDKPTEIRTKEYKKGPGGDDLHTNIPRDGSGDGVGGKNTTFEAEEADKATSNNPDTYVQEFTPSEKPTPVGNENNHTAGTEIKFRPDSELYTNLTLSKKAAEQPEWLKNIKKDKKDEKEEGKKEDDKEEKKDTKDEDKDKEAISKLTREVEAAKAEIKEAKQAIIAKDLQAARMQSAIKYALSLKEVTPAKYANHDVFVQKVEETAKNLSVEMIEAGIEQAQELKKEADTTKQEIKIAAKEKTNDDDGISTSMVIQKTASTAKDPDRLKDILMSGTKLGRQHAKYEGYEPNTKE